ncbi:MULTISPECIES: DUF4148 domain-containing protein [unclassified Acidovorax]|jgi:hypothetical protein|uniref:DUF4148 domain-containing protein n=1 Tax=unclassified Acidovorax TaxID=2684926 RepID=UPI0010E2C1C6|nr:MULTISPECIES: DUF4148 domain-containing protein [unclassified Acidovorax]MDA8520996.1 DUF4148 domain-containing protein [Acidovorax sp. NCPPB 4044]GDY37499.1 hypothetical protein ACINB_33910 [Acidovorax sp. NB1]
MAIRTLLTTIALAALAGPTLASGVIHSANTEMGYTTHPDHAAQGKSRDQIVADMEQSKKDGLWQYHRFGAPVPVKGTALTREEVLADLERAQKHPSWALRRVGAPVANVPAP